jgi:hypothetical protein
VQVPADLCPAHHEIAVGWARNDYNPRWPSEWPGGMGLMDSRTRHDEREREWDRKNGEQVELVARICRSGRSPQCTPAPEGAAP